MDGIGSSNTVMQKGIQQVLNMDEICVEMSTPVSTQDINKIPLDPPYFLDQVVIIYFFKVYYNLTLFLLINFIFLY